LISRKGVELAIRGLAAASTDDVELLIAGTGRLEEALKRLAEQLGVSDRVRFLGYVPDDELPLLYASADVTLFTSNYEGFGLVFLESLASGTPVIGTRVGGIPDLVENGVTGFVVPTSASAIADRIDRIDGDPERLSELSTAARRSVEHRDWEFVAGELESIYNKVVKNKHQ
jgi:phosphatidylinositol alpha-1,6-mannosyltransferase